MNNSLFISRCETILVTMRAGNFQSVTTKQVAQWLNIELASANTVMTKACKFNLFKKTGAASKTAYVLTESCSNSLQTRINTEQDIYKSVSHVVSWFITHPTQQTKAKEVITASGKKFLKIESQQELSEQSKQAIDYLMNLIKANEELQAEVILLREEVERLSQYEIKYKQIKELTK